MTTRPALNSNISTSLRHLSLDAGSDRTEEIHRTVHDFVSPREVFLSISGTETDKKQAATITA
jgi:hypothetical protein